MAQSNPNYIVFVGDERRICDVLDAMAKNINESREVREERGMPEVDAIAISPSDDIDAKFELILEGYLWDPCLALNPQAASFCSDDEPDEPCLEKREGCWLLGMQFNTGMGTVAEDLATFSELLPKGEYAIASCHAYEDEDWVLAELGAFTVDGMSPYVCGPYDELNDGERERTFCPDDEFAYPDEWADLVRECASDVPDEQDFQAFARREAVLFCEDIASW